MQPHTHSQAQSQPHGVFEKGRRFDPNRPPPARPPRKRARGRPPLPLPELREAEKRWMEAVDHALAGNGNPRTPLDMGAPTELLRRIGMSGKLTLQMDLSTLHKIIGVQEKNGHAHDLTGEQVKDMYRQIVDPVAVLKYGTNNYTIVTDMLDTKKRPIIIGVAVKKTRERRCNELVTAYGRTGFDNYMKEKDENDQVYYVDNEKLAALSKRANYPEIVVSRPYLSGAFWKSSQRETKGNVPPENRSVNSDLRPAPENDGMNATAVSASASVPVSAPASAPMLKKLSKDELTMLTQDLVRMGGRRGFKSPGWGNGGKEWEACPQALKEALTPLADIKLDKDRKNAVGELLKNSETAVLLKTSIVEQRKNALLKGKGR